MLPLGLGRVPSYGPQAAEAHHMAARLWSKGLLDRYGLPEVIGYPLGSFKLVTCLVRLSGEMVCCMRHGEMPIFFVQHLRRMTCRCRVQLDSEMTCLDKCLESILLNGRISHSCGLCTARPE